MREHFRGVIWDRDPVQGPKGLVYRYPIVGLICTDFNAELPPGGILVCRSGARSGRATLQSLSLGFSKSVNLQGGMLLWNNKKYPIEGNLK